MKNNNFNYLLHSLSSETEYADFSQDFDVVFKFEKKRKDKKTKQVKKSDGGAKSGNKQNLFGRCL